MALSTMETSIPTTDMTITTPSPSSSPTTPTPTQPTFPLLSLPIELQRLIFHHHYGTTYDITVTSERLTMLRTKFHVHGLPSTSLLLTSRHINHHASSVRRDTFSGRLILNSVFILIPLGKQARFEWLRRNTTILHFSDSSVHPERWSRYWDSFGGLKVLEICFPKVKEVDCGDGGGDCEEGGGLEEILEGRVDGVLLGSLDAFRMCLVDQLRDGRMEVVVRQKFCAKVREGRRGWDGLVDVKIKLTEDGSRVVDRVHVAERTLNGMVIKSPDEAFVHANGNVLDAGAHRSLWEWQQMMAGG